MNTIPGNFMKLLLVLLLLIPFTSKAALLVHYGLNYSSEKETSDTEYTKTRTFHKVLLGASVNGAKTLYFGWNINKWDSTLDNNSSETNYSMLEMGPKLLWYLNENFNWYLTAEWNPYAKGTREKAGSERDITGSSLAAGLGYRFRISRMVGLGAGIHYHSLSMKEETVNSTESKISDKVTNLMPMLELSIMTK